MCFGELHDFFAYRAATRITKAHISALARLQTESQVVDYRFEAQARPSVGWPDVCTVHANMLFGFRQAVRLLLRGTRQLKRFRFKAGRPAHPRQSQQGQGLVEFALVLPLFILLIMGILDFGMALRAYVMVTNASREGARYAIVCPASDGAIQDRVVEYASPLVKKADVSVTWGPGGRCKSAEAVEVKAYSDYTYITPVLGSFLPSPLRLSAKTTMRSE